MKYSILLVFCALGVKGHVFVQESEQLSGEEVDRLSKILAQSRKQLSIRGSGEESGCSGEDSKDRKECEIKKTPEDDNQNTDNELDDEYKKSVDKILNAMKKVSNGALLLNAKTFKCGYKLDFKCQYTTRDDINSEKFYGFETTPGEKMVRLTDAIDGIISSPLVWIYARVLDEELEKLVEEEREAAGEMRTENGTCFKIEKLLRGVKRTVARDPEQMPEKFVCGFHINWQCTFEKKQYNFILLAGRLGGYNEMIQNMVRSEKFQQNVVKFAKKGHKYFPALKDDQSPTNKLLAMLLGDS